MFFIAQTTTAPSSDLASAANSDWSAMQGWLILFAVLAFFAVIIAYRTRKANVERQGEPAEPTLAKPRRAAAITEERNQRGATPPSSGTRSSTANNEARPQRAATASNSPAEAPFAKRKPYKKNKPTTTSTKPTALAPRTDIAPRGNLATQRGNLATERGERSESDSAGPDALPQPPTVKPEAPATVGPASTHLIHSAIRQAKRKPEKVDRTSDAIDATKPSKVATGFQRFQREVDRRDVVVEATPPSTPSTMVASDSDPIAESAENQASSRNLRDFMKGKAK
jgi:hypothetical protein